MKSILQKHNSENVIKQRLYGEKISKSERVKNYLSSAVYVLYYVNLTSYVYSELREKRIENKINLRLIQ